MKAKEKKKKIRKNLKIRKKKKEKKTKRWKNRKKKKGKKRTLSMLSFDMQIPVIVHCLPCQGSPVSDQTETITSRLKKGNVIFGVVWIQQKGWT